MLYYGVLGAHAAWRPRLRARAIAAASGAAGADASSAPGAGAGSPRRSNQLWAQLMQRSFGFDPCVCPQCGGRLRLLALIETRPVIRRILGHLGLPTEVAAARPSRAPPLAFDDGDSVDPYAAEVDPP